MSSLLENTDFENERAEIPSETIITPKANTVKCIHCGKSLLFGDQKLSKSRNNVSSSRGLRPNLYLTYLNTEVCQVLPRPVYSQD